MPVYEFHCHDCDQDFDVMMRMSEFNPDKVKCERCGSKNVSQNFAHFNVKTSKKS